MKRFDHSGKINLTKKNCRVGKRVELDLVSFDIIASPGFSNAQVRKPSFKTAMLDLL